jgi:hypothetical protein
MIARVTEEEVTGALLSALESFLSSSTVGVSVVARVRSASPAMESEVGVAQQVAKGSSKRLEGERAEVMGLDTLSDTQLYMRSRRQCDSSLPEKKMSFCFNHLCNPDAGSRSQKV